MKYILFEPNGLLVEIRREQLRLSGHEVVAHARTSKELHNLMSEFDASLVQVGGVTASRECVRPGCAANIFNLLTGEGHAAVTPPQVWEPALTLATPAKPRDQLLIEARNAFSAYTLGIPVGLSLLPSPWLAGLPGLLQRMASQLPEGMLPLPVFSVSCNFGICEVAYSLDSHLRAAKPGDASWWSQFRREINLSLYPTMWRPLKPAHWRMLHAERKDLRHWLERRPWRPAAD